MDTILFSGQEISGEVRIVNDWANELNSQTETQFRERLLCALLSALSYVLHCCICTRTELSTSTNKALSLCTGYN